MNGRFTAATGYSKIEEYEKAVERKQKGEREGKQSTAKIGGK